MNIRHHLKRPELVAIFMSVGSGTVISSLYLLRLATRGPEVTWSRIRNPEPWQSIQPGQRIKFLGKDISNYRRPASDEAYAAIGQ